MASSVSNPIPLTTVSKSQINKILRKLQLVAPTAYDLEGRIELLWSSVVFNNGLGQYDKDDIFVVFNKGDFIDFATIDGNFDGLFPRSTKSGKVLYPCQFVLLRLLITMTPQVLAFNVMGVACTSTIVAPVNLSLKPNLKQLLWKTKTLENKNFILQHLNKVNTYSYFILNAQKIFNKLRERGLTRLVARGCREERAAARARESTGHSRSHWPGDQDESAYPWQTRTRHLAMHHGITQTT